MDHSSLYSNPKIDQPRFLFVQLDAAEEQTHNQRRMTILRFRVEPVSTELGGTYVYSVLYHIEKAEQMWDRCRQSLRFSRYDLKDAIGRWLKIYLVPSKFKPQGHAEVQYSTIQYVTQTDMDRVKIEKLERLTKLNGIPWDANDEDEAQEIVDSALAIEDARDIALGLSSFA